VTPLQSLFESHPGWSATAGHDADALSDANIDGAVAALLEAVGSGDLQSEDGGLYHLLDPDGIEHWSREVLEKLQSIAQPIGLKTFFIDAGGGTYAFACSNGTYTMHHSLGLLERHGSVEAFVRDVFARLSQGAEPFPSAVQSDQVESMLRQAEASVDTTFDARIAALGDVTFPPYDPHIPWKAGDAMTHPRHGRGIVVAVKTTMYIQVEFASGRTTLGHKGW